MPLAIAFRNSLMRSWIHWLSRSRNDGCLCRSSYRCIDITCCRRDWASAGSEVAAMLSIASSAARSLEAASLKSGGDSRRSDSTSGCVLPVPSTSTWAAWRPAATSPGLALSTMASASATACRYCVVDESAATETGSDTAIAIAAASRTKVRSRRVTRAPAARR